MKKGEIRKKVKKKEGEEVEEIKRIGRKRTNIFVISTKKRKILLTGASGHIGQAMLQKLIEKNEKVLAWTRRSIEAHNDNVEKIYGDIKDPEFCMNVTKNIDVILHFAALVGNSYSSSELMKVNALGTKYLVEGALKNGVEHFIFCSSIAVYAKKVKGIIDENTLTLAQDPYGRSKVIAEYFVRNAQKEGLNTTIIRPVNAYGKTFTTPYFKVFRMVEEGKARIIGNGKNIIPFISIDDVTEAFYRAIKNPITYDKVYLLSDRIQLSQKEILDYTAQLLNAPKPKHISITLAKLAFKLKLINLTKDEFELFLSDRKVDTSKIYNELSFEPKINIWEGIRMMVELYKKQFLQVI
ncbi:MAG: NAD-dependent epimerase/dehydratase family protein [Candidatus Micrarchaeia archaeon]